MNSRLILTIALAQLVLTACASHTYTDAPPTLGVLYSKYAYIGDDGELQPIESVGIVTTDGLLQVKTIDGRSASNYRAFKTSGFYYGGRYQLHLLPGSHTLTLGFHDDRGGATKSWSTTDITKTITIASGQVIHLFLSEGRRTWTAREADGAGALATIISDFRELRQ